MERTNSTQRGQALIEIILGVSVTVLLIAVASHLAVNLKSLFKHDYLTPLQKSAPEIPMADIFKGKEIFFDKGTAAQHLQSLKDDGWEISKKIKFEKGIFYFLKNGDRHMAFKNNLGVITCTTNCEKN